MKMLNRVRLHTALELLILFLLALAPLLPWFQIYDGSHVSYWSMFEADAIDALGNLTYDQLPWAQVLEIGYLTTAIVDLLYLAFSWGYVFFRWRKIILGGDARSKIDRRIGNTLLLGSVVATMGVGILYAHELGWGYGASGAILAGAIGLRVWHPYLRRENRSQPVTS